MSSIPPPEDDEFDQDITGDLGDLESHQTNLQLGFAEVHEAFIALRTVGFTETQALKFLAFCSIYDGDL